MVLRENKQFCLNFSTSIQKRYFKFQFSQKYLLKCQSKIALAAVCVVQVVLLYSHTLQSVKIESVKIKSVNLFCLKLPNSSRKSIKKFYTFNFYTLQSARVKQRYHNTYVQHERNRKVNCDSVCFGGWQRWWILAASQQYSRANIAVKALQENLKFSHIECNYYYYCY